MLAQITAAALGALVVTSEFRTGMIRTTLTACPRPLVVLAAKATDVAGVVFTVTLPAAVAAFGIGRLMLDSDVYAVGDPFPTQRHEQRRTRGLASWGGVRVRSAAGAPPAHVAPCV